MKSLIAQLSGMKKELENLQPKDRMGFLVAVIQSVNAIEMSVGGWKQFLADLESIEKFNDAALMSFYEHLREAAVRQLEFDIKVMTEHADIIRSRFLSGAAPEERMPRGAYVR